MYENIFEDRGVKYIEQYVTPAMQYPNENSLLKIRTIDYIWSQGDKLWRLASKHYGDPRLWWVIAQFNQKPTEGHIALGETIQIPIDIGVILGVFN